MEKPEGGIKRLRAANGAEMKHYGQKCIKFKVPGKTVDKPKSIRFQVTDVQKPLVSVARIVELGHVVTFGPKDEDNVILNPKTGEKMQMRRLKGGYVMDVEFLLNEAEAAGEPDEGFSRRA
jgi:hypothetical protein